MLLLLLLFSVPGCWELSGCRKQMCHVNRGTKGGYASFDGDQVGEGCYGRHWEGQAMHVERIDWREQSSEDVNLSYVTFQCGAEEKNNMSAIDVWQFLQLAALALNWVGDFEQYWCTFKNTLLENSGDGVWGQFIGVLGFFLFFFPFNFFF